MTPVNVTLSLVRALGDEECAARNPYTSPIRALVSGPARQFAGWMCDALHTALLQVLQE